MRFFSDRKFCNLECIVPAYELVEREKIASLAEEKFTVTHVQRWNPASNGVMRTDDKNARNGKNVTIVFCMDRTIFFSSLATYAEERNPNFFYNSINYKLYF